MFIILIVMAYITVIHFPQQTVYVSIVSELTNSNSADSIQNCWVDPVGFDDDGNESCRHRAECFEKPELVKSSFSPLTEPMSPLISFVSILLKIVPANKCCNIFIYQLLHKSIILCFLVFSCVLLFVSLHVTSNHIFTNSDLYANAGSSPVGLQVQSRT